MSTVYSKSTDELDDWIRAEIELDTVVARGDDGGAVRRVQEWLTLHGHGVVVDGDFGPATQRALSQFQTSRGLAGSGEADAATWAQLIRPMTDVLSQRLDSSRPFGDAALEYADAHLRSHPREVGGANSGPWVRLYMRGTQGASALWCAGFVTFLLRQAADSMDTQRPIAGSFSCDTLAAQGRANGLFVAEADVVPAQLSPGSIFLVRHSAADWTHTGLVVRADADTFSTVEGNTNDAGDREGYEVCARTRGYAGKDFIQI